MVKEKLIITIQEAAINFAGNSIDSFRFKDKLYQGYRVYDNGLIGVVGAKGKADDEEMFKKAIKSLENNISYEVELSKNRQEKIYLTKNIFTEKEYLERIKLLILKLKEKYPDFIFSGKANYVKQSYQLKNDEKLDLYCEDEYVGIYLVIKDRKSSNIFDTGYGGSERYFDEEKIMYDVGLLLDKYHNVVDIENGEYPVIIDFGHINKKLNSDLRGDIVASGASIFSNKIGEKIFNDNLTIYLDKNPETAVGVPFFDFEGVVNKNYRYKIIDQGRIVSPYSSKKVAKQYNLPITGSAVSAFDGVPTTGENATYVKPGDRYLHDITEGKKSILVVVASGGDFTSSGEYASPVQSAFLYDKGKIVGRIKDITISSNIYKMFNQDFIGVPRDSLFKYNSELPLIIRMNVRS